MNVEVRAFGPVREAIGTKSYDCTLESDATVGDLLATLRSEFDGARAVLDGRSESGELSAIVTVNKQSVRTLEGDDTALSDGDVVRLSPPIHGG
ncbi:MoaD/ThiS family protein [Halostagnicola bangensis]